VQSPGRTSANHIGDGVRAGPFWPDPRSLFGVEDIGQILDALLGVDATRQVKPYTDIGRVIFSFRAHDSVFSVFRREGWTGLTAAPLFY
jgi:hypothetical protein